MTPYAEVIGDPIAHSKSPVIHNFWLAKLGIEAEYRACHVRADELHDYFANRRRDRAWRGCNVTIPHKQAVQPALNTVSRAASRVGAVNCVYIQQDRLIGENTDVEGVLEALPMLNSATRVLVLGSGGAARAALAAAVQRDVASIIIAARNVDAAMTLLRDFSVRGEVQRLDAVDASQADVLINATSLGMSGQARMLSEILDALGSLPTTATVFDMVYAPLETELLMVAKDSGLAVVDGLNMLIGQASEAFRLFFGQPAPRQHDAELRALLTA